MISQYHGSDLTSHSKNSDESAYSVTLADSGPPNLRLHAAQLIWSADPHHSSITRDASVLLAKFGINQSRRLAYSGPPQSLMYRTILLRDEDDVEVAGWC